MKRRSFISLTLSGIGYIVLGNVMCLVMTMALAMFGKSIFFNAVSILCCSAVFFMLVFTVAWKDGTAERSLVKNGRVDKPLKYRWIFIGLVMFAVASLPTWVLLINKLFFPEADTLFVYRFISGSAFPFIQMFIPDVVTDTEAWVPTTLRQIDNMSVAFPALMLVYYLLIPVVTQLGFYMGYNDKLNTDKIMYN